MKLRHRSLSVLGFESPPPQYQSDDDLERSSALTEKETAQGKASYNRITRRRLTNFLLTGVGLLAVTLVFLCFSEQASMKTALPKAAERTRATAKKVWRYTTAALPPAIKGNSNWDLEDLQDHDSNSQRTRYSPKTAVAKAKTHFISLASKPSFPFCASLASYLVHDAKPVVLNWDNSTARQNRKFEGFHAVLEYLDKYTTTGDTIVIVQGESTWLQKPLHETIHDFKQSKTRILLGAEKNCWGLGGDIPKYKVCSGIPFSPLPIGVYGPRTDREERLVRPRWVNAGTVIGYAEDLKTLYADMIRYVNEDSLGKLMQFEQAVLLMTFYNDKHGMELDYFGDIIKPLSSSANDTVFSPRVHPSFFGKDLIRSDNYLQKRSLIQRLRQSTTPPWLVFDHITKRFPSFLHFNGQAEPLQQSWFPKVWWTGGVTGTLWQEKVNDFLMESGGVRLDGPLGEWLDWEELCGNYLEMDNNRLVIASEQAHDEEM